MQKVLFKNHERNTFDFVKILFFTYYALIIIRFNFDDHNLLWKYEMKSFFDS